MKLENPILRYNEIEIFSNILCVSVCIVEMQNQDGKLRNNGKLGSDRLPYLKIVQQLLDTCFLEFAG